MTSRGNRHGAIYFDDSDRLIWLEVLALVCERFNFVVHAFCQMTNHFHLLIETVDGDLARGMRQLNSVYAQRINRRHKLSGHLLQGRYHAILVQKQSYLLALARYVVLNPVRAGLVTTPEAWLWSSFGYAIGRWDKPGWLENDWLLSQFGADQASARAAYYRYVMEGAHLPSPLRDVKYRALLGDHDFLAQYKGTAGAHELSYTPRNQRQATAMSLEEYAQRYSSDESMARAFWSLAYSMKDIARFFNVSTRTVGRAIARFERFIQSSRHDPPT